MLIGSSARRVLITGSTIAANSTTIASGGIMADNDALTLEATVVAGNQAQIAPLIAPHCSSTEVSASIASKGSNRLTAVGPECHLTSTGAPDLIRIDPVLGPLRRWRRDGRSLCGFDQRGVARTAPCDIGAYEVP